ncbi:MULTISPECIES: acireductone dioxygenase [Pseudomonas]|uniref:Acireductone dioxygenase n=1 Tax=Pseudomonas fluorescens (strain Q2-87) TaxID=1038922 RepID=J2Y6M8_PSEFQ|nr:MULTISPECIES: acireductone dioxygenase [Pseudomonas]EJL02846.1 ARD/ARD' family protein [Pseudomonas fluorescens Q2-87]
MSSLSVYHVSNPEIPNKVLTHLEDIAATLAEQGIHFDRWDATTKIQPGASQEDIIAAYQVRIDALMTERGYATVEVISVDRNHSQAAEQGASFLEEYSHSQDEVRFFVAGRGLFTLHLDDYVYAVLCEKHDLITVPAGTRHWFDMGEHPHFIAIRLCNDPQGWGTKVTGDDIASRFPRLED